MKKIRPSNDEFYIGYLPMAPEVTSFFVKRVVALASLLLLAVGSVIVISQKRFATSEFDYGMDTQLSGVLSKTPVPQLRVRLGKASSGVELFQLVLLVGAGKSGASDMLQQIPEGASITLKGFLIYGDGKALLQLNSVNNVSINERKATNTQPKIEMISTWKQISVQGEVTDPKCYFGVMKPGEGKTHRSCAIRCISGGIPPVLKSNSSDYFLLVNENMQPLNDEVVPIVGDQVELDGEMTELDDWKVLKVDSRKIRALSNSIQQRKHLLAMEDNMTFCDH